jgi:hypothetical protein
LLVKDEGWGLAVLVSAAMLWRPSSIPTVLPCGGLELPRIHVDDS